MNNQKEKKLKLIWDFWGPESARTAEHHAIHLQEFANSNKTTPGISGVQSIDNEHHIAYLIVNETEMRPVRDALKPHRGQFYNEE